MKACLVLVLLVAVVAVHARIPLNLPYFEKGVKNIIEKLKHGNTHLPLKLPSLRPLKIQPVHSKYKTYTLDISEATVEGLENLKVEWVRASTPASDQVDLELSLGLSVPTTVISKADEYHLVGTLMGYEVIDDKGKFSAKVDNLKAAVLVKLVGRGSDTVVADLDLQFSADAEVQLDGAYSIVNEVFNSILKDLLSDHDSEVFAKTKTVVTDMVNQYLKGYTPDQLTFIVEREASNKNRVG